VLFFFAIGNLQSYQSDGCLMVKVATLNAQGRMADTAAHFVAERVSGSWLPHVARRRANDRRSRSSRPWAGRGRESVCAARARHKPPHRWDAHREGDAHSIRTARWPWLNARATAAQHQPRRWFPPGRLTLEYFRGSGVLSRSANARRTSEIARVTLAAISAACRRQVSDLMYLVGDMRTGPDASPTGRPI